MRVSTESRGRESVFSLVHLWVVPRRNFYDVTHPSRLDRYYQGSSSCEATGPSTVFLKNRVTKSTLDSRG